jgi:AcrR family transcriptional regulator
MSRAILETARDVMREEGVAALSLSEVARRLQLTTAALYRYFPSKAAVFDAVYRVAVQVYGEMLAPVWALPPSWQQFEDWIAIHMRFAHDHPELFHLYFERPVPGFAPSEESLAQSRRMLTEARARFGDLIETGIIDPGLPLERALDLFIAMRHGLSAQHVANEPESPVGTGRFGSLIDDATAIFRRAWTPDGPATSDHQGEGA